MSNSTCVTATILRLISLGFWSWAVLHLIIWITHPIAVRIDPWGMEGFDPRRLVTIIGCTVAGAALYAISLPVAVRATAGPHTSRPFAIAFTTIRMVAFCSFLFALVWVLLGLFEVFVRRLTESQSGQVPLSSDSTRWVLRNVFTASFPFLLFGLLWPFANQLAHAITRRFPSTKEG